MKSQVISIWQLTKTFQSADQDYNSSNKFFACLIIINYKFDLEIL